MIAFDEPQLVSHEDLGILDEIMAAHAFLVVVDEDGEWRQHRLFASAKEARHAALHEFQRSGRPVEVRDRTGRTILCLRQIDSQAAC